MSPHTSAGKALFDTYSGARRKKWHNDKWTESTQEPSVESHFNETWRALLQIRLRLGCSLLCALVITLASMKPLITGPRWSPVPLNSISHNSIHAFISSAQSFPHRYRIHVHWEFKHSGFNVDPTTFRCSWNERRHAGASLCKQNTKIRSTRSVWSKATVKSLNVNRHVCVCVVGKWNEMWPRLRISLLLICQIRSL